MAMNRFYRITVIKTYLVEATTAREAKAIALRKDEDDYQSYESIDTKWEEVTGGEDGDDGPEAA